MSLAEILAVAPALPSTLALRPHRFVLPGIRRAAIALGSALCRFRIAFRLPFLLTSLALLSGAGCDDLSVRDNPPAPLVLHVPDIGQGHCVFLESRGRWAAIDAGPPGQTGLASWMRSHLPEEASLEALVLTHGDLDHVGGLDSILAHVRVRQILHASGMEDGTQLDRVCAQATLGCRAVVSGDSITALPGILWTVLAPGPDDSGDVNSRSLVSLLRTPAGAGLYLDPGDIDSLGEARLRSRWEQDLHASVLRLPHHGSRGGSSLSFLGAVAPRMALVQAGKENTYGHPHESVVARLLALGIPLVDTRQIGSFRIEVGTHPRLIPQ